MKYLVASLLLIASLSSCTTYQYTSLKSDLAKADDSEKFYYQDSLVRMDFNFWGRNFPVQIVLENISDSDLYLDLSRTLFMENDRIVANAIPSEKGHISGIINYQYDGLYSTGSINATTETKTSVPMIYIPSGKTIQLKYSVFSFPYSKEIRRKSQSSILSKTGTESYMRRYVYPDDKAPDYAIRFYFLPNNPASKGHITECSFSPDMVISGSTSPDNFGYQGLDLFYTQRYSSGGGFLGITGIVILLILIL